MMMNDIHTSADVRFRLLYVLYALLHCCSAQVSDEEILEVKKILYRICCDFPLVFQMTRKEFHREFSS